MFFGDATTCTAECRRGRPAGLGGGARAGRPGAVRRRPRRRASAAAGRLWRRRRRGEHAGMFVRKSGCHSVMVRLGQRCVRIDATGRWLHQT